MSVLTTAQITLQPRADADAIEQALRQQLAGAADLAAWHCGRNLEGCWGAGHFTVDMIWRRPGPQLELDLTCAPGVASADVVGYDTIGSGLREPDLGDGIWRTLLLTTRAGTAPAEVVAFEQELLGMPGYMRGIRNWRLGRVTSPGSRWTHVWQQEYSAIEDLAGEYLQHPYHWGWVDRRFDPEFPQVWVVETQLCHAFCPLQSSIINRV
ncbi:MAG: Dabb family protein [Haliea sp.]|uniref:Dabb family protein n=1 Tax=Haliea sp. TaxID=1932666 RepID=UPI0032ECA908